MAFVNFLDHGARRHPDQTCLQMGSLRLSYRELQRLSYRIGNKLASLGLGRGSHASVLAANDLMAFACVFGFSRAGVTWVPANPKLSADDIQYQCDFFDCSIVIFQQGFAAMMQQLRPSLPNVRHFVCLDAELPGFPSLERWLEGAGDAPLEVLTEADDLAMIMPTGGTTGRSKGVSLTNRSINTFVGTCLYCFGYPHDQRPSVLAAAPLTHASGLLSLHAMTRGGRVVIIPKADPAEMLDVIEQERITEFFLPPTVIYRMLDVPGVEKRDFSSVRYFVYAAAPISVEKLKQAVKVFGPCMTQVFGQAEAPAVCTFLSPRDHFEPDGSIGSDERLGSCGYPTPMVQIKILDDDNAEVADGQRGEICVKSDLVMKGYYKKPDITAATIVDGWLHTGDIGFKDAAGRVHIADRKKDMIISGGFNIYPQEIEQVVWSHPAVQDCAVVGVPDADWGEAVKVVVELNAGAKATEAELIALCKKELGSLRTPKSVDFVETLPRSPNGKVLKREIRDRYWVGRERKI
ncbi:MAG: AMP-binding protein [Nevskia sp.]|nr:AMP-binding protein [Nevskia sp.]